MRIGAAALWGLVIVLGAYPILRVAALATSPEPNPAEVIWTAHAGYFARAWLSLYVGTLGGIAAFVLSRGRERMSVAWASRALAVAVVLLVVQAVVLP